MRAIWRDYRDGNDFYICQHCRCTVQNIEVSHYCQHCGVQFNHIVDEGVVRGARHGRARNLVPHSKPTENQWFLEIYQLDDIPHDIVPRIFCSVMRKVHRCTAKEVVKYFKWYLEFEHLDEGGSIQKCNPFEYEVIDEDGDCFCIYFEVTRQPRA